MALSCQISPPEKANKALEWKRERIISREGTKQEMNEMEDEKSKKVFLLNMRSRTDYFSTCINTWKKRVRSRVMIL